jgi:hypothetical protein
LGRIYRGPSPSERPPRAHYPLPLALVPPRGGSASISFFLNRTPRRLPRAHPRLSRSSAGRVLSSPCSDSPPLALKSCDLILSAVLAGILIWATHLNRCGEIRGELPGQTFPRPRVPCAYINRRPYSSRALKPPSSASAIDTETQRYPLL